MMITILAMILLDRVHPPAIATSMSFDLRASNTDNLLLFSIAVGMTAVLVVLERWQSG